MRFISWNVNGIRSCLESGEFDRLFNTVHADFYCLQEIRLSRKIKIDINNYEQFWHCSTVKGGYAGTAIFCKEKPLKVTYGIEDEYQENFDKEGRVITLEYSDFFLVNCYIPNTKTGVDRLNYRLKFDDCFREHINKLNSEKNVIVCGDFNIAYQNIDVCKNYRVSDSNKNALKEFSDEEKSNFKELLEIGLIDSFRYFHPQSQKYTWWLHNSEDRKNDIGWRLDYFLISEELRKSIRKADILTNVKGSDHCPIELELKLED